MHSAAFLPAASMGDSSTSQMVFSPRKSGFLVMGLGDLEPPLYELDLDSAVSGFMSLNAVFKTAVTSLLFGILPVCLWSFIEKQKAGKHSF